MAVPNFITTGEQAVSSTGAITGSLTTSSLSGGYTVKARVRGLLTGQYAQIALEDTAAVTAFSDALQPFVFSFQGATPTSGGSGTQGLGDGVSKEVQSFEIPGARFGATHNAFRVNAQVLGGTTPTVYVTAWIEQ